MTRTITSGLILFAIIWFAVSNAAAVTLNVFFWNVSVSAAFVIFITFLVGFVFGVLRVAPSWFRKHSQIGKQQRDQASLEQVGTNKDERIAKLESELAQTRRKLYERAPENE